MYNKIVLNIPHSSTDFVDGTNTWSDQEKLDRYINKWTDWNTKEIFCSNNNPRIVPHIFRYSRFCVDVERLINDPLETEGQGIVYTRFHDIYRHLNDGEFRILMSLYKQYVEELSDDIEEHSLVIDCHSFPDDIADDLSDICIGYNEDFSKPDNATINTIVDTFDAYGFTTKQNYPYSNSITPNKSTHYTSIMIEINKRVYLDKDNTIIPVAFNRLISAVKEIYNKLLRPRKQ